MATATMTELKKKYGDVSFIYLTNCSSQDAQRLAGEGVTFLYTPWTKVSIPKIRRIYSYLCYFMLLLNTFLMRKFHLNIFYRGFCSRITQADLLIDLGGDSISVDYLDYSVFLHMLPPLLMFNLKKPYYLLAQSIGPFKKGWVYRVVRFVLQRAELITIREKITAKYLTDFGVQNRVALTADIAFLLEPVGGLELKQLSDRIGLVKGRKYAGVSVSNLIFRYARMDSLDARGAYISQMAQFCDYLVEQHDMDILFISHVTIPRNDDRIISREVHQQMRASNRAIVVEEELNAAQWKGLLGECVLFVGSRMHAAIGAISQKVPTILIAYNHKAYGIFSEMLGLGEFLIDIRCLTDRNLLESLKQKGGLLMRASCDFHVRISNVLAQTCNEARTNFPVIT